MRIAAEAFSPPLRIPGRDGGELHALVHDTDFAYGHDLVRNHGPEIFSL